MGDATSDAILPPDGSAVEPTEANPVPRSPTKNRPAPKEDATDLDTVPTLPRLSYHGHPGNIVPTRRESADPQIRDPKG